MKKIIINNETFYYESWDAHYEGDYDSYFKVTAKTQFYTKGLKKRKKYFLFGPKIDKVVYNYAFSVDHNIEDPSYSKEQNNEAIDIYYNNYRQMNIRKLEIEKGDIL